MKAMMNNTSANDMSNKNNEDSNSDTVGNNLDCFTLNKKAITQFIADQEKSANKLHGVQKDLFINMIKQLKRDLKYVPDKINIQLR